MGLVQMKYVLYRPPTKPAFFRQRSVPSCFQVRYKIGLYKGQAGLVSMRICFWKLSLLTKNHCDFQHETLGKILKKKMDKDLRFEY